MYSTSALLVICGIPATIILFVLFMHANDQSLRLSRSQALLCGGYMIAAEILLAVILHFLAARLGRRRTKNDIISP